MKPITIIVSGFLILVSGLVFAADWPQYQGPERNGVSSETGLLLNLPKDGPPKLWEKAVGEGFSGPVIQGNRCILFHRVGDEEVVESLDASSGKEQWKYAYPTRYRDSYGKGDGPRATPVIAGGRVYTLGAEGTLHCLDLENGKRVWSRSLMEGYGARPGFFGIATSPIVEGDLLLVNVGGKEAGIVAFNKNDGKEVWKATDHEASYSSPVAATIAGKRQIFFFTREGIVILDPASGAVRFSKRWRSRNNASVNAAAPLVIDDHVFFSSSYATGAILLHVGDGKFDEVWKSDEALSCHYNSAVRRGDYVYGIDGRQEEGARLRCIEWKTGKVQWTKEQFGCGSIILADGHLIVLDESGDLVVVEATPEGYREKSRASVLSRPTRALPALANGRLYARDDKKLICLNLKK